MWCDRDRCVSEGKKFGPFFILCFVLNFKEKISAIHSRCLITTAECFSEAFGHNKREYCSGILVSCFAVDHMKSCKIS